MVNGEGKTKIVFYLKRIVLCLENEGDEAAFGALTEKAEKYEIAVAKMSAALLTPEYCEEQGGKEHILYITDVRESAVLLYTYHMPVLGWQKEDGSRLCGIPYVMECPAELEIQYLERVYRRFWNIPWDIAETERCLIRESTVQDVDSFYKIYRNPEIVRYTEGLYPDREQECAYIREYIEKVYRYYEFGVWTVVWKETGEVIGRAGYSVREGYDLPELGFVIGIPWQGQGVAFEVSSAILQYGEEELDFGRVQALVRPGNAASLALCKKLGFTVKKTVVEEGKEFCFLVREENGEAI